ncbi:MULTISPECIES: transglycosylase domain-containing protein [unclassified Okeania]|uniref:transglycosylase domain-containing protein n=1 Tax=unclassified Okeania TaxID=2634635 RepID=UPI0013BBA484|nr:MULTISPECIES: transglycosylase domain-containing protein [unclassified Okeania]NES74607.1 FHA domain-containing protein [Okeania sp. SIO1H4]NET14113.1 FHA domain-containing protein [Okeania sp. SIO1H6]NET18679.1 FHA domain-containing protein [Okeania sp. SIO1H5]NET92326.1 FHA domain-containing protein [Okeania sp. SIO1H2]
MNYSRPPRNSQTLLGNITQVVKTIHANVNFSRLALRPNAKLPELWIQETENTPAKKYPLLGDRYLLGRSSQACDIVIRNPLISKIHLSVSKNTNKSNAPYVVKDENSANGLYNGKKKISRLPLRHGDVLTLGPPALADTVKLRYVDPPAWYIQGFRYGIFGISGLTALISLIILLEWTKFQVDPLPNPITGPVVVYARDRQTPLRPAYRNAHYELGRISKFSKYLPDAVIASEDSRFYWHFGVDPIGITRAVLTNLRADGISQGGSTVTQQLARSVFRDYVGTEDSLGRKVREAIVSFKIEAFYSKNDVLLNYLNKVYLGLDLYGFEDASRFYFGKSAQDLTLSEAATLVGILPAPNTFNPVENYQLAIEKRDGVIYRMLTLGMIDQQEADRARRSRVEINPKAIEILQSTIAPYYYSYVFSELEELLGEDLAREGNFIVQTALNPEIQTKAEISLKDAINNAGSYANFSQGAVVTIDSTNGEVIALTGGADYQQSQFNRATQAQRQPGSTFKVFAYAAALERGIPPTRLYSCNSLRWMGQTYGGCQRSGGNTNMYTGIALSENVVALRVAQQVGLGNVVRMAKRLGIKSKLDTIPGLILGQNEVNVLEMTGAYGAIANRGVGNRPHTIRKIIDSSDCSDRDNIYTCRCIYSYNSDPNCENPQGDIQANRQILQPQIADTMTQMLQGVVQYGTGRGAYVGLDEAGKTGTTNRGVDLWFVGYIPNKSMVTGIWLGNDDNSPTYSSSGQAAQLWGNYMKKVVGE